MIEQGKVTLLEDTIYLCEKIEDGVAYLKRVGGDKRGRYKKMKAILVPYLDENNVMIEPKPLKISRKKMKRFDFMKRVRDEIDGDFSISHDLAYCISEWLDTVVRQLTLTAMETATKRGDKTIDAGHWYWLQLSPEQGEGIYISENREFANDYKRYLDNGGEDQYV